MRIRSICNSRYIIKFIILWVLLLYSQSFIFADNPKNIPNNNNSTINEVVPQKQLFGEVAGSSYCAGFMSRENWAVKRSDLEFFKAWNDKERDRMIEIFAPTIYNIGTSNHIPLSIPKWSRISRSGWVKINNSAIRYAKRKNLKIHSTIHMFVRQVNYSDSAVKIGIDGRVFSGFSLGESDKELPKKQWRMCVAHDAFRKAVKNNIKHGIDQGVTIFEFQDAVREYYSCFCEKCVDDFRNAIQRDPRLGQYKKALLKMGVQLGTFDVRQYAYEHTTGSQMERQREFLWRKQNAVSRAWLRFKFNQLKDFLDDVISYGRSYARTKGETITFLLHLYYLKQVHLDLIDLFDGIWAEMPLYRYALTSNSVLNADDYYPPVGIMGACASVLAGISGRKLTMWVPWGVPFPELAYKKGPVSILYQIWLAEIYANGGVSGVAYGFTKDDFLGNRSILNHIADLDKQHFSPDKILPDRWLTPVTVGRFGRFLRNHTWLYNGNTVVADVLLIKTRNAYKMGAGSEEDIYGWAELLSDSHIPFRAFFDGNGEFMKIKLTPRILKNYNYIVALGSSHDYNELHLTMLREWLTVQDHALFVMDDCEGWRNKLCKKNLTHGKIIDIEDMGAEYQRSRRAPLWLEKAMKTFRSSLKTNLNQNCLVRIEKNEIGLKNVWILHLVNRNYNWIEDTVTPITNVKISLNRVLLGLSSKIAVQTFNLNGQKGNRATCLVKSDVIDIKLPVLYLYTVIQLYDSGSE